MANLTRRQWLKVGLAAGGLASFALSYREVAKRALDGLLSGTSGKVTRDRIFANALIPEANANTGWQQNPRQVISMTQCFGCWTQCGVRVRVDSEKGQYCALPATLITRFLMSTTSTLPFLFQPPWRSWRVKADLMPALPPARAAPRSSRDSIARCGSLSR